MRTIVYVLGAITAFLLLNGILFKTMHWEGAGIMLVVAVTLASFVFTPLATIHLFRSRKAIRFS